MKVFIQIDDYNHFDCEIDDGLLNAHIKNESVEILQDLSAAKYIAEELKPFIFAILGMIRSGSKAA